MNQALAGWDNFYVIIGSSAAALTGLQFVVIALVTEVRTSSSSQTLDAFATPTIVHFCVVLMIAAIVTMPGHSTITLTTCLMVLGGAGVIYALFVTFRARHQRGYKPVLEDWIFHAFLPVVAYAWLFAAGAAIQRWPAGSLYCVAGSALTLLFVGIHNAWDAAVWMTTRARRSRR